MYVRARCARMCVIVYVLSSLLAYLLAQLPTYPDPRAIYLGSSPLSLGLASLRSSRPEVEAPKSYSHFTN